jgi:valyl-tRNA synthetase
MSKSKGNVIDPLEVMDKFGTDAFRFTLAAMAAMGRDVKLAEERIVGYQNFVNKLWNAARFVLMNLSAEDSASQAADGKLNLADQWILSRLAATIEKAREAVESYRFNEFAHYIYQFTWHEFCDWYIEMSKLALNGGDANARRKTESVLAAVLENILLLLHPIMPFVTEEIWHALNEKLGREDSKATIMLQPYPKFAERDIRPQIEDRVGYLMEITRAVRNLRAEMNCPPSKEVNITVFGSEGDLALLREQQRYLTALARVGAIEYRSDGERPKGAATAVIGETEVYIPLGDMINLDEEKSRLTRELGRVEEELTRVRKKLGNNDFLAKAKEEVVRREKEKAAEFEEKIRTLNQSLGRIGEIAEGKA